MIIDMQFIPLDLALREERCQTLRALLLQGARRSAEISEALIVSIGPKDAGLPMSPQATPLQDHHG